MSEVLQSDQPTGQESQDVDLTTTAESPASAPSLDSLLKDRLDTESRHDTEADARIEQYASTHPALAGMLDRAKALGLNKVVDSVVSGIRFGLRDARKSRNSGTEPTNDVDQLLMSGVQGGVLSLKGSLEKITEIPPKRDVAIASLEKAKEFYPQMLFITDADFSTPEQNQEVLTSLLEVLDIKDVSSLASSREGNEAEKEFVTNVYPGATQRQVGPSVVQEAHFNVPEKGVMVFKIISLRLEADESNNKPTTITAMAVFEPTQASL